MFKLVVCFFLVFVAVASAVYHTYDHHYFGAGAYGAHGPFAVSYTARVDAPREDLVAVHHDPIVPYAYHF